MKAEIWRRDEPDTVYDELADKPFKYAVDASVYDVRFVHTDDPFFYDMTDRTGVYEKRPSTRLYEKRAPFFARGT